MSAPTPPTVEPSNEEILLWALTADLTWYGCDEHAGCVNRETEGDAAHLPLADALSEMRDEWRAAHPARWTAEAVWEEARLAAKYGGSVRWCEISTGSPAVALATEVAEARNAALDAKPAEACPCRSIDVDALADRVADRVCKLHISFRYSIREAVRRELGKAPGR